MGGRRRLLPRRRAWRWAPPRRPGWRLPLPRRRAGSLTMPAPLGKTPTRRMPNIQVFGLDDSSATRAAIRFFRERRIIVHYVDLRKQPIAPAELRRFVDRLGATALLDTDSRAYRDAGLAWLTTDTQGIVARVHGDVRLLRLPLVRHGEQVTAGPAEATWKAWLAAPR
jgi:arsenate reductase